MASLIFKTLASTLLVAVLAGPAVAAPKPSGKAAVCALGAQILAEHFGEGMVFNADGEHFKGVFTELAGSGLPRSLRRAAARRPPGNLFATCPELAKHLPAGTRLETPEDDAAARGGARLLITVMSAPLIDDRGETAAVYWFNGCGSLCGNGGVFIFHRRAGRWVMGKPAVTILS